MWTSSVHLKTTGHQVRFGHHSFPLALECTSNGIFAKSSLLVTVTERQLCCVLGICRFMLHLNIAWQVVYQYKKLNSLDKNCDHFTVYKKSWCLWSPINNCSVMILVVFLWFPVLLWSFALLCHSLLLMLSYCVNFPTFQCFSVPFPSPILSLSAWL